MRLGRWLSLVSMTGWLLFAASMWAASRKERGRGEAPSWLVSRSTLLAALLCGAGASVLRLLFF